MDVNDNVLQKLELCINWQLLCLPESTSPRLTLSSKSLGVRYTILYIPLVYIHKSIILIKDHS